MDPKGEAGAGSDALDVGRERTAALGGEEPARLAQTRGRRRLEAGARRPSRCGRIAAMAL